MPDFRSMFKPPVPLVARFVSPGRRNVELAIVSTDGTHLPIAAGFLFELSRLEYVLENEVEILVVDEDPTLPRRDLS